MRLMGHCGLLLLQWKSKRLEYWKKSKNPEKIPQNGNLVFIKSWLHGNCEKSALLTIYQIYSVTYLEFQKKIAPWIVSLIVGHIKTTADN